MDLQTALMKKRFVLNLVPIKIYLERFFMVCEDSERCRVFFVAVGVVSVFTFKATSRIFQAFQIHRFAVFLLW